MWYFCPSSLFPKCFFFPYVHRKCPLFFLHSSTSSPLYTRLFLTNHHIFPPTSQYLIFFGGQIENIHPWSFKDLQQIVFLKEFQQIKSLGLVWNRTMINIDCSGCTLILTEGDSAKTLAVAGLGVIGRDYYGVYPLKVSSKHIMHQANLFCCCEEEIFVHFKA